MFLILLFSVLLVADVGFFIADKYIFSFFWLLGILVGSYFFVPEAGQTIATYGWTSFFTMILPIYLGIGIGVAVIKWFFYNLKIASKIKEVVNKFNLTSEAKNTTGVEKRKAFAVFWNYQSIEPSFPSHRDMNADDSISRYLTPRAKKSVDRITFWILQWPIVVVATLLEDILIKLGKHIATLFDYLFTQMAKKLIHNATKSL